MSLPVPGTEAGRAGLAALVRDPRRALIALDFDGTLSPIVADPADARGADGAADALAGLAARAGTVAIITGRPAADAVELGGFGGVPGLIVLGQYGRERWHGGRLSRPPASAEVAAARAELPGVLAAAGAPDGTWTEDKGDALAVHTRRTPDPAGTLDRLRGPLAGLAERAGLIVEPGRLVLELRPVGADKGAALTGLVAERSAGAVLYAGDDLGDIPAFEAVAELRADGVPGLAVFSGSAESTGLAAHADLLVDGPAGILALLRGLAAAFGPDSDANF
ncbi:MAG TPA: trehalose-phosphatase [Streptosporangiaceae bacterium]|nr:trehalose-phosphatase [Streptosporangiaceae bacterium]